MPPTKTWTVDASAMGAKGMLWRTHVGSGQFLTRPGDDDNGGFARNGSQFEGVEEEPGWVRCTERGNCWLPLWDGPAFAANKVPGLTSAKAFAAMPAGRSALGRDRDGHAIPFLHIASECGCGGRWCKALPQPPQPEEEITVLRRRVVKETAAPAVSVAPRAPRPSAPPFLLYFLAAWCFAGLCLYLYHLATQPETMEQRYERSLGSGSRIPPLYTVLEPVMQARRGGSP